jgi:signal peptidase II
MPYKYFIFFLKKNYKFVVTFFLIILLDRITKIVFIRHQQITGNTELYSSSFLNLDLIWNKGIAFGLFSYSSPNAYNLITMIIFFVILGLFFLFIKSHKSEKFFLLIVFSGAVGNLVDRLLYKAVPDFIDLSINNIHWFIFNVADIFITLGITGLILIEFSKKKND